MKQYLLNMSIVAVFVTGLILGIVGSHLFRMPKRPGFGPPPGPPPHIKEKIIERLTDDLDLNEEQIEKVKPAISELHEQLEALRQQTEPDIKAAFELAKEKISPVLNKDQKDRLDELFNRAPGGRKRF